jgi:two-component system alkaline phosphatase synthesis response regulator PhoP
MGYRILLIDDEDDILEFVKYNLSRDGYEVFTASNGAEGLKVALDVKPHLILLDMMMPVLDGIETCKAIRNSPVLKNVMVVFLSAVGSEETQLQGYNAGADDYINKPIKMNILRSRVQAILKRIPSIEEPVSEGLEIDVEHYQVKRGDEVIVLPRKEFSLLQLLHSEPGKLFTREEIYAKVWGSNVIVGDRTIDVHIRKLRQKIGEEHIVTIKGVGYKYNA